MSKVQKPDMYCKCRWSRKYSGTVHCPLHAAAPDLLAALKALRQWHKEEYQSNKAIDAQADAAIAKAERKTP